MEEDKEDETARKVFQFYQLFTSPFEHCVIIKYGTACVSFQRRVPINTGPVAFSCANTLIDKDLKLK